MQTLPAAIVKKLSNPYVIVSLTVFTIEFFLLVFFVVLDRIAPELRQLSIIAVPTGLFFLPTVIAILSFEPAEAQALFHEANPLQTAWSLFYIFIPTGLFWSLLVSGIVYIVQRLRKNTLDNAL